MSIEERAVVLTFNADLDTASRLSREDFARQAGGSLERSLWTSVVADHGIIASGTQVIAIPGRHRSPSSASTGSRAAPRSPSWISRPRQRRRQRNSSEEEGEDMNAIFQASRAGQQMQIEERCADCGYTGVHRISQVRERCGKQGTPTAVSRAARAVAAASRAGTVGEDMLSTLSPASSLPTPRPANHRRCRSPSRTSSPRSASRPRHFGSLMVERWLRRSPSPRGLSIPLDNSPKLPTTDRRLFSPSPVVSPSHSLQSSYVHQALVAVKAFQPGPLSTLVDPFAAAPGRSVPPSTLPVLHAEQLRLGLGSSRTFFQPTVAQPSWPPTFPWEISQFSPMARPPPRPLRPLAKSVPTPAHQFPPAIPAQMSSTWSPMLPITLPLQWAGSAPPVPRAATPGDSRILSHSRHREYAACPPNRVNVRSCQM